MRTFVIAALFASASALSLTQLQYLTNAPADCKENDTRAECKKAGFAAPADCKEGDNRAECKKAGFNDDKCVEGDKRPKCQTA